MIDEGLAIKTALLTQTALTALTGTGATARIWPARSMPIVGYHPNDGVAIAFRTRGGGPMYQNGLINPSVQFKVWGIDEQTANTGYRALVDVLHDKSIGAIKSAYLEVLGQTSEEQETGWPFVLTFFTIWLAR
jgi:hypothetical protein